MQRFQIILQCRLALFGFGPRVIRRPAAQKYRCLGALRLRVVWLAVGYLRRHAIGPDLRRSFAAPIEVWLHARAAPDCCTTCASSWASKRRPSVLSGA